MKRIFVPLFFMIIVSIYLIHKINPTLIQILFISIVSFIISITSFYLNIHSISYISIIISISLLFGLAFQKEKNNFLKQSKQKIPEKFYITAFGTIIDFTESNQDITTLFLQTEKLEYIKKSFNIIINIKVKVKGRTEMFAKGDRIRINLKTSKIVLSKNFYKSPLYNYFIANRIHFTAFCKSIQMISILKKNKFWHIINQFRVLIKKKIEKNYFYCTKSNSHKKAFIKAILLGDRENIDVNLKESLLNAGIYHIFAISGAHIGIITLFIFHILSFLGITKKKRLMIIAISILFYLIISGGKIPAQRAVFMALIIIISKIIYQKIDIYNIIAFSGIIILFFNPTDILNPGFVLTFTLSAGIIAGRKLALFLHYKTPQFLKELISASLSGSFISLPLSLFFFKRFSLISFFSTIILIPIAIIIIGLSFLLFPFSFFPDFFTNLIFYILDPFLSIFFYLLNNYLSASSYTIYRASPPVLFICFYLFFFALATNKKIIKTKIRKILIFILILLTIPFLVPDNKYKTKNLELYFLDVGQGDSTLIVFPDSKTLLIDGGGSYHSAFEVGTNIVLPFLLQKRIKIDWIAISHSHPDHVRGIIEIIHILKPKEIWLSQKEIKNSLYLKLINKAKKITKIKYIDSSFKKYGNGYKIECLYPNSVIEERFTDNNNSQILKISNNKHTVLFTGDIEKKTERFLANSIKEKLKSTILKVPHHGSKTSSTKLFLNYVNPKIAVFSSKRNNKFGFPHKKVLENYRKQKTKMLFTSKNGGIKIELKKDQIIINKSK